MLSSVKGSYKPWGENLLLGELHKKKIYRSVRVDVDLIDLNLFVGLVCHIKFIKT